MHYLTYPIFAQISGNMLVWLESREQLLSQQCPSSCRANPAKVLKAGLDYVVSILSLIWPKFRYLEYTDFCDKRDIVRKLGSFGERFKKDFEKIEKHLRNPVAHGGDYAHNDEEMKLFIANIDLAEKWINKLQMILPKSQEEIQA